MKIGVLSDTHLKKVDNKLRRIAEDYFKDVDIIVHAGDIVSGEVLEYLKQFKLQAVRGNMDFPEVQQALPDKKIIELAGHKIGIIHGWGAPFGLEKKIIKLFDNVQCIIYGHTHKAFNGIIDGVLFFNPGSPTDRFFSRRNTIGVLEITPQEIKGKIIDIK